MCKQAYGEHVVYRDLNFTAERGQRIVLVGPNGAGKSTLLKILADIIPIQGGTRELGSNVVVGYFAQNRLDNLKADATVFENVMELRTVENQLTEQQVRAILGAFLFRKDDVHKKPVSVLSGGENPVWRWPGCWSSRRILLLMDEPTTHLDIQSIDALIGALKAYEGTLIFISHDVHFIRTLAQTVLHVHSGRLTPYAGNYDYYLEKSKATNARAALTAGFTDARPTPLSQPPLAFLDLSRLRAARIGSETNVTAGSGWTAGAASTAASSCSRAFTQDSRWTSCCSRCVSRSSRSLKARRSSVSPRRAASRRAWARLCLSHSASRACWLSGPVAR
jgi:ABC-type multidrug transport system ATPase subunit